MKSPFLAIVLGFISAASLSCSSAGNQGENPTGTGGTTTGGQIGSGGVQATGGTSSTGGRDGSGGTTATGGRMGSGGAPGGAGGQTSTGGTTGTGGQTSTGGATATGGTSSPSGGSAGSSVPPGTGGAAAGGNAGTNGGGGSTSTGGTTGGGTSVPSSSAGCGKAPTLTSGSRTLGDRKFMLRIPPDYDNKHPYPLVFAFHWNGGNMNDVDGGGTSGYTWSYYGLREQADNSTDKRMIFVAPDGGGGWPNTNGRDLTFVDDMLKQITGDLCVDTTRIFSMGFSYGGGMSYAIACARAKVFRAVAVYSGAQLSGCTGGADPIAYMGIHSVSDGTCNYGGGESLRTKFVTNNGCTAQTPPKPGSGNVHVCTSFSGCRDGYPVRWCAFDGGGHTPAPVDGSTSASGGGDKTWTKAEVWKFFTQF